MQNTAKRSRLPVQYNPASWLVTVIGGLLGIAGLAYLITHPEPVTVWAVELALVGLPAAAIIYGGYWMATHPMTKEHSWSIAKGCLAGGFITGLLFYGYSVAEQVGGATVINVELLVLLGALGGAFVSLFAAISNERQYLTDEIGTGGEDRLVTADVEPVSDDAETLANLVVDTRSWYTVRALVLAEKPLGVETLAAQIASVEETDAETVYIDLVHVRLPKLAEQGLVHYDSAVDIVQLSDRVGNIADASEELLAAGERLATTQA